LTDRLVHFLEGGRQTPQLSKPQLEQGPTTEALPRLLYFEQNVDSFDDMCDTYRARRRARDHGPFKDSAEGFSTGSLFSPDRDETDKMEEDWDDVLYRGWQRVTNLLF